ncbi:hypothetical protein ACIQ2D_00945 [Lysinibacillus sp. NPDC097287]|uniref:hypothetical protein n=1 Tax=Lysinibacillus sp. NPDC097287 TaxID=3364144 RepID=UPI00381F74B6
MKFPRVINYTVLAIFTFMVIIDFFPSIAFADVISKKVISAMFIALIILQLVVTKGREDKLSLKQRLSLTIYIIGLWITLTLLGGHSQVGLSLNSPMFYFAMILLAYDLLRIYRQSKNKNNKSMPS